MTSQIAINYRVNRSITPVPWTIERTAEIEAKTQELMFRDEREYDIEVPYEIFNKGNFDFQKKLLMGAIAKTWGIEFHRATPDFDALTKLLDVRYSNLTDDIDHEDFFRFTPK